MHNFLLNAILLSKTMFTKRTILRPFYSLKLCSVNAHKAYKSVRSLKFTLHRKDQFVTKSSLCSAKHFTLTIEVKINLIHVGKLTT